MAAKVRWGWDTVNNRFVSVDTCDRDLVKDGKIICKRCGDRLTICDGDIKDIYFRHCTSGSKCNGARVDYVLKSEAIRVCSKTGDIMIPRFFARFRDNETAILAPGTVLNVSRFTSGKRLCSTTVIPDLMLFDDSLDITICIEFLTSSRGISKSRCKDYGLSCADVVAMSVDISDLVDDFVLGDEKILNEIQSRVFDKSEKKRVFFRTGVDASFLDSKFEFRSGRVICPAYEDKYLVDSKKCNKCPFFIKADKGVYSCYGKRLYSKASDVTNGSTYEQRQDLYCDQLPTPIARIDYRYNINMLGSCPSCGESCVIAQGDSPEAQSIRGIQTVNTLTQSAYKHCNSCGTNTEIRCPKCGGAMRVLRSAKHGKIYLICENHDNVGSQQCNCSLTLFNCEPCRENYADEVEAVGGLDNFLSGKIRYMNALDRLRDMHRRR